MLSKALYRVPFVAFGFSGFLPLRQGTLLLKAFVNICPLFFEAKKEAKKPSAYAAAAKTAFHSAAQKKLALIENTLLLCIR